MTENILYSLEKTLLKSYSKPQMASGTKLAAGLTKIKKNEF